MFQGSLECKNPVVYGGAAPWTLPCTPAAIRYASVALLPMLAKSPFLLHPNVGSSESLKNRGLGNKAIK